MKISSAALDPAPWQNDSLHILTSAHDYRNMNDFLMKKVHTHTGYIITYIHIRPGIEPATF